MKIFSNIIICLFAALATSCASLGSAQEAQPPLPIVPLQTGLYVIQAEVAQSFNHQAMGLMFREKMADNTGMIFLWEESSKRCMWMRNTLLPLSVAFLDAHGKILNIEDMQPKTEDSHCSKGDAKYALEMNQGWFKKKRIAPGAKITGIPGMATAAERSKRP